jgi:branched-subunit amino acid aminotransferase/4-amino-4-deoxychorismate lyase
MNPVELIEGYLTKLKASEKELKRLEKSAKALATKQADTDAERIYLEAKVLDHQRDTAALGQVPKFL